MVRTVSTRPDHLPGSLGSSTVDWESVSLIDSGLSFQNTTRFQFSLVNVVYPLSAADSSSLTNYPALVAALKVEVFWPSVDRFWRNPLAGDMIDLVTNSAASAGAASIADNDSRGWSRALINSSIAHPWSTGWSDGPLGEAFESAPCSARSIATSAFAVREMEMDSARLPGSTLDGLGEFGWSRDEDLRFKIANETIEFGPHGFRRLTDSAELSSDGDACWDGEEDSWRQFPSFSSWTLDQWQGESPQTAATEPGPVSLLTAEATRLGFQRLLATDMVFEAMSEDLVDVGILAQEQLHVTTSATAVLGAGRDAPERRSDVRAGRRPSRVAWQLPGVRPGSCRRRVLWLDAVRGIRRIGVDLAPVARSESDAPSAALRVASFLVARRRGRVRHRWSGGDLDDAATLVGSQMELVLRRDLPIRLDHRLSGRIRRLGRCPAFPWPIGTRPPGPARLSPAPSARRLTLPSGPAKK